MNILYSRLILALFLTYSLSAQADFSGIVVRVSDGDTIKVMDDANALHTVRMTGIDAPEKKQAYGVQAQKYLSDLIIFKAVTVQSTKTDRYGRQLGKVIESDRDINLMQIEAGMAWFYTAYQRDQPLADRQLYKEAEGVARAARYGLWSEDRTIPPWDYRKGLR